MPLGEARNRIAEVIDYQLFVGDHTVNIDMPINIPSTFGSPLHLKQFVAMGDLFMSDLNEL